MARHDGGGQGGRVREYQGRADSRARDNPEPILSDDAVAALHACARASPSSTDQRRLTFRQTDVDPKRPFATANISMFQPREEPGALAAHAEICARGGDKSPFLPLTFRPSSCEVGLDRMKQTSKPSSVRCTMTDQIAPLSLKAAICSLSMQRISLSNSSVC